MIGWTARPSRQRRFIRSRRWHRHRRLHQGLLSRHRQPADALPACSTSRTARRSSRLSTAATSSALLTLGQQRTAGFVFFLPAPATTRRAPTLSALRRRRFALLNPNTRTCPVFRSQADAELTKNIYRRVPMLIDERSARSNPWGVFHSPLIFDMNKQRQLPSIAECRAVGTRRSAVRSEDDSPVRPSLVNLRSNGRCVT